MKDFVSKLEIGEDVSSGMPRFGISVDDFFIFSPYESSCGRFMVDPTETYGLSKEEADHLVNLNQAVEEATQSAIRAVQQVISQKPNLPREDREGAALDEVRRKMGQSLCQEMLAALKGEAP